MTASEGTLSVHQQDNVKPKHTTDKEEIDKQHDMVKKDIRTSPQDNRFPEVTLNKQQVHKTRWAGF